MILTVHVALYPRSPWLKSVSQSDEDGLTDQDVRRKENWYTYRLGKARVPPWDPGDKPRPGTYRWHVSGPICSGWYKKHQPCRTPLAFGRKIPGENWHTLVTDV